jgi:uncharacterized glyoxalase superfamily protein PhnB
MLHDGKIMHAELKIGDSILFLCDEFPDMGNKAPTTLGDTPVTIHIYVDNVDAFFDRAIKAGAQATMPLSNMFWGDRYGKIIDPFGHRWGLAMRVEELTADEIEQRQKAFFAQMAQVRK